MHRFLNVLLKQKWPAGVTTTKGPKTDAKFCSEKYVKVKKQRTGPQPQRPTWLGGGGGVPKARVHQQQQQQQQQPSYPWATPLPPDKELLSERASSPTLGGNSSYKESPVLPIPSYPALCREDTTSWNDGRPKTHPETAQQGMDGEREREREERKREGLGFRDGVQAGSKWLYQRPAH